MDIPRRYREQVIEFEKHGFHVSHFEITKGSHAKFWFSEFPEFMVVSANIGGHRNLKNSIARLRRYAEAAKNKEKENEKTVA